MKPSNPPVPRPRPRTSAAPPVQSIWDSLAASDVLYERRRQVLKEGWTPEHDDSHVYGEMSSAASCYATMGRYHNPTPGAPPDLWPWAAEQWKPAGYRDNLVKAGALLIAEIERLDRAAARPHSDAEGQA